MKNANITVNKKFNKLIKKSMTKKQLANYMSKQRSAIGQGRSLGTKSMASEKDYSRQKEKRHVRREVSEYEGK